MKIIPECMKVINEFKSDNLFFIVCDIVYVVHSVQLYRVYATFKQVQPLAA